MPDFSKLYGTQISSTDSMVAARPAADNVHLLIIRHFAVALHISLITTVATLNGKVTLYFSYSMPTTNIFD